MPINLQGSGPITEGWGAAPTLNAPNLGGLVEAIMRNKLLRDKMTQENIAETIKNAREERQSAQYLDAMKAAGLVPQGYDAGGMGGATLAGSLAKQIEAKRLADARAGLIGAQTDKVNTVAEAIRSGNYGTGRSRGGGGYEVPDEPETQTDSAGRVWQKTRTGWKPLAVGLQPTDVRTQNENQVLKEQAALLEQKGAMDADVAKEKAANETLNKPNVPFSHSDEYNRMVNRLKQIQQMRTAPSTQPEAAPQPSPAETGDALPTSKPVATAEGYGNPVSDEDVAALGWARAHPDDPRSAAILRKLGIQ